MLDTMIFDRIVADPVLAETVAEAAGSGRVTIVTTHVQEDQIVAIPDQGKRRAISRLPRRTVPTVGFVFDVSRFDMARLADDDTDAAIDRIGRQHRRTVKDALIAASVRGEADALVTEDKTLLKRIRREGLALTLFGFEEFREYVTSP